MSTGLLGAPIRLVEAGRGADPLRGNIAHHVGDDPAAVLERRRSLASALGRPILWMNQTHSSVVALASKGPSGPIADVDGAPRALDLVDPLAHVDADGLVVDARDWEGAPAVAVMTADCLPVLLAGADGRIVAAVHAGRRGLFDSILTAAVERIRALDAASPIEAYIGPAICGRCYEVPGSMRDECGAARPESPSTTSWGTPALDLVRAAEAELLGVGCSAVRLDGRCTLEDAALHSYRRDPHCGRNAAIIAPR